MRTSLIETRKIEEYLLGGLPNEEHLLMDAELVLDAELKSKLEAQQLAYDQVSAYGRKQLKADIQKVHLELFTEARYTSFRRKVYRFFSKD